MVGDNQGRLRVAVTGASGYLGRAVCRKLLAHPWVDLVVGLDVAPPPGDLADSDAFEFYRLDVMDEDLADRLTGIDAVCHLAFVLDSNTPDDLAHRVNVEGSFRVLQAAVEAGLSRIVVASSVSAYGALPDNPPRLRESDPLRAGAGFRYAHHKVLVERMLDRFEVHHPDLAVVRLRIATILGPPPRPGTALEVLSAPVLPMPRSFRVQFVHVEDVAEAFLATLQGSAHGAYNVATSPPLSGREIAVVTGQHYLPVPSWPLGVASKLLAAFPVQDPGRLDFIRHSIVVDTSRIETDLGWRPSHDGIACLRALFP